MSKERRIGVYVCYCGGNISDYVDVEAVRDALENEDGVVVAKTHMFTCSDASQQLMIDEIGEENLDGIVVASCSPKLHLHTFREMAKRAGLNEYTYSQVNIREQDSWTHRHDVEAATEKAIRLVRGGVAKTKLTAPLKNIRIETKPRVLIVGAGAAGLRASLVLADMGLTVYLLEKEDEPGGWVKKWGKMFPNNKRGDESIAKLVAKIRTSESITLYTNARLIEKSGSLGDFEVKIEVKGETIPLNVGAIIVTTGFKPYELAQDEFGHGLNGVITLPEYKEILFASGEDKLIHNGKPVKSVTFVHCVGSRQRQEDYDKPNLYCSRYCCTASIHSGLTTRGIDPSIHQYHLFRDIRSYGRYELLYEEARNGGSLFLRYDPDSPPIFEQAKNGRVRIQVKDQLTGNEELELETDLVVLATGMVPRENDELNNVLKLPIGLDGFYNEIHPKLRPVETVVDGVFIAGTSQGPKNLAESVSSALASVSKSGGLLMKGYVDLEPFVAIVDADKCTWCGKCEEICPYGAIEKITAEDGSKEIALITKAVCKGGGTCVPVCPEGAIDIEGYTNEQITSLIDAMIKEVV
ncbi:CoB--CoM heterodisulfide reductase iron-sulfur subunit A family protein [bacterium]|nr:CoB--CoM heterodisulfide reductase iron-sulfur subunit A family protein [bacterium]